jgi:hypothetical protein
MNDKCDDLHGSINERLKTLNMPDYLWILNNFRMIRLVNFINTQVLFVVYNYRKLLIILINMHRI